jgi:hypothetical protein
MMIDKSRDPNSNLPLILGLGFVLDPPQFIYSSLCYINLEMRQTQVTSFWSFISNNGPPGFGLGFVCPTKCMDMLQQQLTNNITH